MLPGACATLLLLAAAAGCSSSEPVEEQVAAEIDAVMEEAPAVDAVSAKLALADMADGTADQVVKLCAGCALGMEGSAEHAVEAHGYVMHFCSDGCKTPFAEDPDAAILALVIDQEPPPPPTEGEPQG
jgi:YHS domain-containing protein